MIDLITESAGMKYLSIPLFVITLLLNVVAAAQDRPVTINNNHWLLPDINRYSFAPGDTIQAGRKILIRRSALNKFVPAGYSIPSLTAVKELVNSLQGTVNTTGGKAVDSVYFFNTLPAQLHGIYFSSLNRLAGIGYMTAFYTSTDTLWKFDTTGLQQAQVLLHIYRAGNGTINVEPTYNNLKNGEMYGELLLIRRPGYQSPAL